MPQARIDDAVRRILREKFGLGLFEQPFADRSGLDSSARPAHRAVARRAAAESQVLLKNTAGCCRWPKTAKVYVAGSNADDIGNQSGGWTIAWQGGAARPPPGTTILAGIKQVAPGATVTYSQGRVGRPDGQRRRASWWWARRRTPRAWATSATAAPTCR